MPPVAVSSRKRKRKQRTNAAGRELLEAARQMHHAITTGDYSGTIIRHVEIPEPGPYSARRIRALRKQMDVSQAVFAAMLGVSVQLVQAWEQGSMVPRPIARRLLDHVANDPQAFCKSMIRRRIVA